MVTCSARLDAPGPALMQAPQPGSTSWTPICRETSVIPARSLRSRTSWLPNRHRRCRSPLSRTTQIRLRPCQGGRRVARPPVPRSSKRVQHHVLGIDVRPQLAIETHPARLERRDPHAARRHTFASQINEKITKGRPVVHLSVLQMATLSATQPSHHPQPWQRDSAITTVLRQL
jgi:hypothetical protein